MKKYSNRVKELRLAKSLSQEQLAEKIGLTKQAISQYERGDSNPERINQIEGWRALWLHFGCMI